MADSTNASITIAAPAPAVMAVIADFPAYPTWANDVKSVEVLDQADGGRAEQVRFSISSGPIKDTYVLAYTWDGDRSVSWNLVEAKMQKAQQGSYTLSPAGSGTEVTYRLSVDINMPMIGLLRRKAEKTIVDTALKELKKRVEAGA